VGGIHRIVAAVVEEVSNVVRAEYLDQALILSAILVQAGELVARRSEGAPRGMAQGADRRRTLQAGVDQILGQRTDDAVAAGIDLGYLVAVLARRFYQSAGGGVDDGGHASRLRVERILGLRAHFLWFHRNGGSRAIDRAG
jgi:hypothetical protein